MVTKDQLTEAKRGKGGTVVRLTVDPYSIFAISETLESQGVDLARDTYVVKDLMARKQYDRPDSIGIGPADRGIAFRVTLDQVELA